MKLITFVIANAIAYLIFGYICGEFNPLEWHWGARIVAVLIELGIINSTLKD